ncbi:MAG: hypothetical protein HY242_15325 [Afipia sp.]|nr:hypothetical protein [Afipia sp.]
MHRSRIRLGLAVGLALALSACSSFERDKPVAVTDDDAYCRRQGYTQGSKEYAACLKDRDVAASRGDRIERAHRNLAEDMLNRR